MNAIFTYRWINKVVFIGDYFWQKNVRRQLKEELPYLKSVEKRVNS